MLKVQAFVPVAQEKFFWLEELPFKLDEMDLINPTNS